MAPEMTIYHGGDLAAWDDTDWFRETYRREIDWLAERLTESGRTLDVAMLPVSTSDGYQEDALLDGLDEALAKLQPRQVLPMHAFGFESLYDSYIERESAKQNPIRVHRPVIQPSGMLLV
jgi:L-ascorbate metabolism protein UlaG (beta-lactamase superfamily)